MHKINLKSVFVFFVYVFGFLLLFFCLDLISDLYFAVKSFDVADDIKFTCVTLGFLSSFVLSGLTYLLNDFISFIFMLFGKSSGKPENLRKE